jgi:hypothetical protein
MEVYKLEEITMPACFDHPHVLSKDTRKGRPQEMAYKIPS